MEMNRCWPASRHVRIPAVFRIFRWCEIVGCDRSKCSATCPHDSSPASAISRVIRRRVPLASAFNTRIRRFSSAMDPEYIEILQFDPTACVSVPTVRRFTQTPEQRRERTKAAIAGTFTNPARGTALALHLWRESTTFKEAIMTRQIAVAVAVLIMLGSGPLFAQEAAPGPGS